MKKEVETMPKFLDLFAGAGGLSEGFIQAGYTPIAHVEMDVAACYTLKTRVAYHWLKANGNLEVYHQYLRGEIKRDEFYAHIPEKVLNSVLNYEISNDTIPEIFEKVDHLLGGEELDLIIGGPPCQAYSLAGRSRSETKMVGDKRNYSMLVAWSTQNSYIKVFDETLANNDPDNYYMEREWRVIKSVAFGLNDIQKIYLPSEQYVEKFQDVFPSFSGEFYVLN